MNLNLHEIYKENSNIAIKAFWINLIVNYKDYYFSNVIARSSKTMLDCNNSKIDLKRTGTEG